MSFLRLGLNAVSIQVAIAQKRHKSIYSTKEVITRMEGSILVEMMKKREGFLGRVAATFVMVTAVGLGACVCFC